MQFTPTDNYKYTNLCFYSVFELYSRFEAIANSGPVSRLKSGYMPGDHGSKLFTLVREVKIVSVGGALLRIMPEDCA